ncbi:glycoside hydrolase family 2 protein [Candidatus Latescibacterota bacterium]
MLRGNRITVMLFIFVLALHLPHHIFAQSGRVERELSGSGWKLWLDRDADWKNDPIFLPPVDIAQLPVNTPTCGWDALDEQYDRVVDVPCTVEEHFWGVNGNPIGTAGDFRGVSWWSRTFTLDSLMKNGRLILAFGAVNLRAEVFVNRKLVGYDVIGNTPFEVDITFDVNRSGENRLDIRITDPCGNFNWNDNDVYRWGSHDVPAVHGFGGITGKIYLRRTDAFHVDDVYVENKPDPSEAEVFVTIGNSVEYLQNGTVTVTIHEWNDPSNIIWEKSVKVAVPPEGKKLSLYVKGIKPKLWGIREPNLYVASVEYRNGDGMWVDTMDRRFGFRWFDVGEKNGDKRFYLNGKRVFLFCAMTRGYWGKNGIFPTDEMTHREMEVMKLFNYNTMLFHRAIGPEAIIKACEEEGFLTYEEPSGYRCLPEPDDETMAWRREKLRRMIMRERSSPSMVIYNLKNEAQKPPSDDDIANLRLIQKLDPGRIATYNSDRNRDPGVKQTDRVENDPYKLHVLPFDDTFHYDWFDHHHWFRYPGYIDDCYENPRFFLRGVINSATSVAPSDSLHSLDPGEIIFWGEEGQWGTIMRLQKIKEELAKSGSTGWREKELLSWYDYYDRFLDESGFRSSFPSVDDLTMSIGRNLHYFHGRILENVRMGNVSDAYNLNGWAAPTTSEDIVSTYRYPTADPSILSHYSQPLYVAVKIRDKVLPVGTAPVADFFIVNELDLKGKHTLEVELVDPTAGKPVFKEKYPVRVTGGEEFGELLVEGIMLPEVTEPGHYRLNARLMKGSSEKASGFDEVFAVDYMNGTALKGTGAVIDSTGIINRFLNETVGITLPEFDPAKPDPDFIIIGPHDFNVHGRRPYRSRYVNAIMDRVANGTKLIILDQADKWAENVMDNIFRHPSVNFKRSVTWRTDGRFIAGKSRYLDGLPQSQGMNWEYQAFYRGRIWGLDMNFLGNDLIVGLTSECRKDILVALTRIPFVNGEVFLSTLDIVPALASDAPQSVVAKKLFLNLLRED